jgi:hypothetical protein
LLQQSKGAAAAAAAAVRGSFSLEFKVFYQTC